jgi:hypothetical protein
VEELGGFFPGCHGIPISACFGTGSTLMVQGEHT